MAAWKEMVLSGSAATLNSITTLSGGLAIDSGGTGIKSYTTGDLLIGNASSTLTKFAIGAEAGQVLKVADAAALKIEWGADGQGGIDEIEAAAASADQLTIANGTSTPAISVDTAAITGAGTGALATGLQIETFVNGSTFGPSSNAPFTNNIGTITALNAGTVDQNSLTLTSADFEGVASQRNLILGGSITGLDKTNLQSDKRFVTIGTTNFNLGTTSVTAIAGLEGIDFTAASKTIFSSVDTLSMGGAGEVLFAGNLIVEGTASFENSDNVRIKDKVFILNSGSAGSSHGGIFIQQLEPVGGAIVGEFFGFQEYSNGGTNKGRWGFISNGNINNIDGSTSLVDGTPSKPYVGLLEVSSNNTAPTLPPEYGGSAKGQGTLHCDTAGGTLVNQKAYVYI